MLNFSNVFKEIALKMIYFRNKREEAGSYGNKREKHDFL